MVVAVVENEPDVFLEFGEIYSTSGDALVVPVGPKGALVNDSTLVGVDVPQLRLGEVRLEPATSRMVRFFIFACVLDRKSKPTTDVVQAVGESIGRVVGGPENAVG